MHQLLDGKATGESVATWQPRSDSAVRMNGDGQSQEDTASVQVDLKDVEEAAAESEGFGMDAEEDTESLRSEDFAVDVGIGQEVDGEEEGGQMGQGSGSAEGMTGGKSPYGSFRPQQATCVVSDFEVVSEHGGEFVNYVIDVQEVDLVFGIQAWTVYRRFSLFARLHEQLQQAFEDEVLPELPPKSLFRDTSSGYAEARRKLLQKYVSRISANQRWWNSEPVSWFLSRIRPTLEPKCVLVAIPDRDVAVHELAIVWRRLKNHGLEIVFGTEFGHVAEPDTEGMDTETGSLAVSLLGSNYEVRMHAVDMLDSPEYNEPVAWSSMENLKSVDAVLLVAGHRAGVRPYLESAKLQSLVRLAFEDNMPLGAVGMATVLVARTCDVETGESMLCNRRSTTVPKLYQMTCSVLSEWGASDTYAEEEVGGVMRHRTQLHLPFTWGTVTPAACVDGTYVSARWAQDAHVFADKFLTVVDDASEI